MNEFILVEFLFETNAAMQGASEVVALGKDFILVNSEIEWSELPAGPSATRYAQGYQCIRGKIKSETATAIKLGNPFLANRMRISYIPDELKDKYRNR